MRLDKFLSVTGTLTRSESGRAVRGGRITVNGIAAKKPDVKVDPDKDIICLDGVHIVYRKFTYIMLNKPEGYVSATDDKNLPTVLELLPEELQKLGLFPCGRLDKNTLGLMILTNNGQLAHTLLSPKHHVEKVYYFECAERLPDGAEDKFLNGVTLADGYECKSAEIVLEPDRMGGVITLTEGKYHQIKRMVAASDNRVMTLERISFGGIKLDTSLARGEWRYLTEEEIELLVKQAKN
jgi:16S rRNA pseudouridine516 synthase